MYQIVCLFFILGIVYVIYQLYISPYRHIPGRLLYRLSPIPSRLEAIRGQLANTCEEDYYRFGDIYTIGPGVVIVSNPDDCRTALATHQFKKSIFYQAFALVEENIYTTQSAHLANLRRRQLHSCLSLPYIQDPRNANLLSRCICNLTERWNQQLGNNTQITIQHEREFVHLAIEIMDSIGYNQGFSKLGCTPKQIAQWIYDYNVLSMIHLIAPITKYRPFNWLIGSLNKSLAELTSIVSTVIQQRKQQQSNIPNSDILQSLLDNDEMSHSQAIAENIAILIAGTEIASLTMTWALHYLMLYPEAYRRAVSEVRSQFHTPITYSQAKQHLPYLEACIYEAMRICAATGVFLPRVVPRGGVWFQGHFLPEGTELGINIAGANHHQQTWSNPRRYNPQRFIDNDRAKANVLTFSFGARACPGRSLALCEMVTVLANLLRDFDFVLPEDAQYRPDRLDKFGNPKTMPRYHHFTSVGPKYPDRDCQIVVTKVSKN